LAGWPEALISARAYWAFAKKFPFMSLELGKIFSIRNLRSEVNTISLERTKAIQIIGLSHNDIKLAQAASL
jgi:hypothetical protein